MAQRTDEDGGDAVAMPVDDDTHIVNELGCVLLDIDGEVYVCSGCWSQVDEEEEEPV